MPDPESLGPLALADQPECRLGNLMLAPSLLQVAGPAGSVDVEPQVMRLLVLLARQPGTVLGREAIIAQLWPATLVGEDSLHRVIALGRRALAASGAAAAIATLPRIGYRLVLNEASTPDAGERGAAPANLARRRWLGLAASAGVAAAAAILTGRRQPAPPQRSPRVVALANEAQAMARLAEPSAERQGAGMLREAVRLAPADSGLWGQLALALCRVAEYSPPQRVAAALAEAEAAARRALAIDPDQPDARAALLWRQPLQGNLQAAETGFRAILADTPDHLPALDGLTQVQAGAGLLALHYPGRLRTVALDPLHAGYNFRSIYAHWMNGKLAEADRAGARGLELWPRHNATWNARTGLFLFSGRPHRALALLNDAAGQPELPPPYVAMLRAVAMAEIDGGRAARGRAVDKVMATLAGGGPFLAVTASMALAQLGAADRALQVAEAFLLERGPLMVEPNWRPGQILHNDVRRRFTNFLFTPVMAPVQALPGFGAMTAAIGLEAYWQASGQQPEHLARR